MKKILLVVLTLTISIAILSLTSLGAFSYDNATARFPLVGGRSRSTYELDGIEYTYESEYWDSYLQGIGYAYLPEVVNLAIYTQFALDYGRENYTPLEYWQTQAVIARYGVFPYVGLTTTSDIVPQNNLKTYVESGWFEPEPVGLLENDTFLLYYPDNLDRFIYIDIVCVDYETGSTSFDTYRIEASSEPIIPIGNNVIDALQQFPDTDSVAIFYNATTVGGDTTILYQVGVDVTDPTLPRFTYTGVADITGAYGVGDNIYEVSYDDFNLLSWLSTAVNGVFATPILRLGDIDITLSAIVAVPISLWVTVAFLKKFSGG